MRFDDSDDLDGLLAPDLAALGEQLSADANHLAHRYPPRSEQLALAQLAAAPASRSPRSGLRLFIAAAAVCLAVGVTVALFPPSDRTATDNELAKRTPPSGAANDSPLVVPAVAPQRTPAMRPAVFDPELSGPELEAVLDLLEPDPLASFSI